ncbi:MAG: dipeptide/oligopeptide/nickel ABC transporter ATP-binding protein [Candidatus Omnitrophica bacterium]|nr:dipeptide/oligopeptide/nickel ABC transporter ATP-binding protein [Candidatus Omnitrophota bacterium]MBU1871980.1 dipeptide/oligopeptide/nickel ABC transporter ATP-binding protein [Candidatus Omnitrophota bacterium]
MSLMLEVKNLKKYFPVERGIFRSSRGFVKALDGVSFKVEKASTLGIVGRSGSGKTTLAKLLVGLIEPTQGEIIYNQRQIKNFRKEVQIIFQNPYQSLNPKMRIRDILREPLAIHCPANKKNFKNMILMTLESVGLDEGILRRYPVEFSGGQRQRICLARSLILRPKFLILDEPVSSLDLTRQVEILDLLKSLKDKFSLTYIFITHNLALLKEISDSIMAIDKGRVVEQPL